MSARLRDEDGVTLVELLVVMMLTAILMGALVNVFVSGTRTAADATARVGAQQGTRDSLDRLEFEARCATGASIVLGGGGVALTLPAQCSHANGSVCWGVAGGALSRFPNGTCTGSGVPFVRDVTSATPFSIATSTGELPRLEVALTVNSTSGAANARTLEDAITLRNAART